LVALEGGVDDVSLGARDHKQRADTNRVGVKQDACCGEQHAEAVHVNDAPAAVSAEDRPRYGGPDEKAGKRVIITAHV
jgi:hypothetical protein